MVLSHQNKGNEKKKKIVVERKVSRSQRWPPIDLRQTMRQSKNLNSSEKANGRKRAFFFFFWRSSEAAIYKRERQLCSIDVRTNKRTRNEKKKNIKLFYFVIE